MAMLNPFPFPYLNTEDMKRPGREIEYDVFSKLGSIYNDKVEIIYGPMWVRLNKLKQLRDGEFIDFAIIHPEKGMIFLECKGGQVEYRSKERKWYHLQGRDWKIINPGPTEIAKMGKNSFFQFLKRELNLKDGSWLDNIPTVHGAIFPNTPKPDGNLPPDIKPEMIIWGNDYFKLEDSLNKVFNLNKSHPFIINKEKIEEKNIQTIIDKMLGNIKKNPFGKVIELGEAQQDLEFDRQQRNIYINAILGSPKFIVKGLAGTGKTILAAQIAQNEKYKDKRVLLLSKTNGLTQFLYVQLKKIKPNKEFNYITINNIDHFVQIVGQRLRFPLGRTSLGMPEKEKQEHFDNYLPQMCKSMFEKHSKEKYDLVIIDEGQDYHKNWFSALESITKENGQFLIFYDPLQNTMEDSKQSMSEILKNPIKEGFNSFPLTANYRNSSSISNFLAKLIKKYFPAELNYSEHANKSFPGRPPDLIEIKNFDELVEKTINKVKKLMDDDKIKPKDIGVIGVENMLPSKNNSKVSMRKELEKLGLKVIKAEEYSEAYLTPEGENSITFENYRRFKGLEKRSIVLVNIFEINAKTVQKIYTGLSRARGDLTVVAYPKAINQMKELF